MRKILAFCVLTAAPILAADNGVMTAPERAFLIEQLEKSKADFIASITGLTLAQWQFKPGPDVWSVAECSEHIILAEDFLRGVAQGMLKSPAVDRLETATAENDRKLVSAVEDRSHKAKAPEQIVPSGKFPTPDDAIKEFTARRDKSLEYARASDDDLRVHVMKGPAGPMDAYQFLLLMASHTSRHTEQIREVQANPNYPKATAQVISR